MCHEYFSASIFFFFFGRVVQDSWSTRGCGDGRMEEGPKVLPIWKVWCFKHLLVFAPDRQRQSLFQLPSWVDEICHAFQWQSTACRPINQIDRSINQSMKRFTQLESIARVPERHAVTEQVGALTVHPEVHVQLPVPQQTRLKIQKINSSGMVNKGACQRRSHTCQQVPNSVAICIFSQVLFLAGGRRGRGGVGVPHTSRHMTTMTTKVLHRFPRRDMTSQSQFQLVFTNTKLKWVHLGMPIRSALQTITLASPPPLRKCHCCGGVFQFEESRPTEMAFKSPAELRSLARGWGSVQGQYRKIGKRKKRNSVFFHRK